MHQGAYQNRKTKTEVSKNKVRKFNFDVGKMKKIERNCTPFTRKIKPKNSSLETKTKDAASAINNKTIQRTKYLNLFSHFAGIF